MIKELGRLDINATLHSIGITILKILMFPIKIFMNLPGWIRGLFFFIFLVIAALLLWWYIKNKDAYLHVQH